MTEQSRPPTSSETSMPTSDKELADTRERGWSMLGLALGAQVAIMILGTVFGLMFLWDPRTQALKPGAWPIVLSMIPAWAIIVAAVRHNGARRALRPFGAAPLVRASDLPWFVIGVAGQFATGLMYAAFDAAMRILHLSYRVSSEDLERPAKELLDSAGGRNLGFVALALAVGIGAPIMEELFYRGIVWRGLSMVMSSSARPVRRTVVPIVVSAVLFGAIHVQPLQFPALAVIGGVCAYAAYRTGRLAPAILVHMGFNIVTVVALGSKL
jgi:membrane protease YdiL (CAAX protease family)